ncbi:prolyl oligopeptidase family serine peptidase [Radiobacillus kanasensis]|uniref:prolyl oligopeptidase family serine peptidase n=1 Tax=Radiobacillus kanasensis TaxID=2844358 RepID=UPI001E303193|nr:prolyl oligopeptidase family serine peptidase [Radiobacillus kanasensis]UFU00732.1 prolyl oligopeptidase family serine peptidase [Radiobacillus kanasensis]
MVQDIVQFTLITEVKPKGEKVIGALLEFLKDIKSNSLTLDTFSVKTKLPKIQEGQKEYVYVERTIKEVYTNFKGEMDIYEDAGRFVLLKFDEEENSARATYYDSITNYSERFELHYTLQQNKDITYLDEAILEADSLPIVHTKENHLILDDFQKNLFRDNNGKTLPYRLYAPPTQKPLPLVLFLHGAGERGDDNFTHLASNRGAICWADSEQQAKHPAFVLAPQADYNEWWTDDICCGLVLHLLEEVQTNYFIDPNRIYITGLSMGGYGTWKIIQDNPELAAAAIPICGFGDVELANQVKHLPIWTFHSIDDPTVPIEGTTKMVQAIEDCGIPVIYGEYSASLTNEENKEQAGTMLEKATRNESRILYTRYKEGTTPFHPHFSWIPTFENKVVMDWLFQQKRN